MSRFRQWVKGHIPLLVCGVLLILLGFQQVRHQRTTKTKLDNLDWQLALAGYDQGNTISIEVGVIQFLERGYSVHLESVDYTEAGLVVTGRIGNPTNLWISSLTLNFRAVRPEYTAREEYLKKEFRFFLGPEEIGKAQTFIGLVEPGRTAPFRLTIPNVKQTSERIQLVVKFSGERYSYLRE